MRIFSKSKSLTVLPTFDIEFQMRKFQSGKTVAKLDDSIAKRWSYYFFAKFKKWKLAILASTTILGNEGSVIWLCVVSETPLRQLAVCMRGNLVRSMIRGWHVIIFLSSFRSIGTITTAISSMMPPTNHSGWGIPRPSRLGLQSGSRLEKSTTIRLTDAKPGTRPGTIWGQL